MKGWQFFFVFFFSRNWYERKKRNKFGEAGGEEGQVKS